MEQRIGFRNQKPISISLVAILKTAFLYKFEQLRGFQFNGTKTGMLEKNLLYQQVPFNSIYRETLHIFNMFIVHSFQC